MNNLQKYKIRRFFKQKLAALIFLLYRAQASHSIDPKRHTLFIGECTYSPWLVDREFQAIFSKISGHTLVDLNKLYLTFLYIKQLCKLNVSGDYLEVGVWRGGLSALVGMTFARHSQLSRTLYLADTYEGMPKTVKEDNFYKGGELADTSVEIVTSLFQSCDLTNQKVLKGYFPDDTAILIGGNHFAYVHIDVDIFESAKKSFDYVWPKMSINGMVVFDDYGYSSTEGVTSLIDNYISSIVDAMVIFNMGGQAIVIKLAPSGV